MKKIFIFSILILAFFATVASAADIPTQKGNPILSRFSSKDIDGKTYDQSVFSGKKVTMLNIWGTFCPPCIQEMPDLGELNKEYAGKGFQIIGVVTDVTDRNSSPIPSQIKQAKDIIAKTKADYLHLLPSDSLNSAILYYVQAIPFTIFVDENGNQIGTAYMGRKTKRDWDTIIKALLDSVK